MAETSLSPPASATPSRKSQQFLRFFSTESGRSSSYDRPYEFNGKPEWNHSFSNKDFLLKLAELLIAIICTGLYSDGIKVITNSITTMMFPNIVFSSFIIITSVIIISYILGHVMPEVLMRIFNTLGAILYFVSGAITAEYWLVQGRFEVENGEKNAHFMNMLLAETILSFLNSYFYGLDVYFSMKHTLKSLEIDDDLNNRIISNDRTQSNV